MEKISETILKFLRLDNLIQHLTGYVEARVKLMRTEILEDVTKAMAKSIVTMALFLMGFLFLIFFSVGAAHFLNRFFEASYGGYWSVAGFYGLTFLVVVVYRKSLFKYFEDQLSELIKRKEK